MHVKSLKLLKSHSRISSLTLPIIMKTITWPHFTMGSVRLEFERLSAGNWLPPPLFCKPTYKNRSSNVYTSGFATFRVSGVFWQKCTTKLILEKVRWIGRRKTALENEMEHTDLSLVERSYSELSFKQFCLCSIGKKKLGSLYQGLLTVFEFFSFFYSCYWSFPSFQNPRFFFFFF